MNSSNSSYLFPLWKLRELYYLSSSLIATFALFCIEDFVPGFRKKQLTFRDLTNAKTLSSLINKDVVSVTSREEQISLGAGGTGTDRFAIVATLRNGAKINLFCKVPATAWFERVFLTIFQVYQNEINFYENVRSLLPDKKENSAEEDRWCPEVYYAK